MQAHCGPTNTRLRTHLGLLIPKEGRVEMGIADQKKKWSEGKIFTIDDSFEHEVWQQGETFRLVLLIDFWHPNLSPGLRQKLQPLPVDEFRNLTTVFHVSGIVNEITSSVTEPSSFYKNPITTLRNTSNAK